MGKPAQIVTYQGMEHRLVDLCERLDRDPMLVRQRLRYGWDLERALHEESRQGCGSWEDYQRWLARNRVEGAHRNRTGSFNRTHADESC